MVRTYRVFGITCDHCKRVIQEHVGAVDGVRLIEVDIDTKTVKVGGDVDDVAVRAAISDAGYEVVDVV